MAPAPDETTPDGTTPDETTEVDERPPLAGRVTDVVVALVVLGLGLAALAGSWALGVGTPAAPGTGTWPLLVSAAIVALGVVLLALTGRLHDAERFTRSTWLVVAGLATMVAFVAVLEVIGFEIPAALLTVVWLRFLGREGWRTSVVTSLAVVAGFYVLFVGLLSVPIPHLF